MQLASAILSPGWTFAGPQSSSNGAHVYLVGVATPAAAGDDYGVFAFDAATLAPQGQAFFSRADSDAANGYMLAETWPH